MALHQEVDRTGHAIDQPLGIGARIAAVEGQVDSLNVNVPFCVAEVLGAQRRVEVVDPELQVVIAALAGEEPREHVVGAVGDVETAIGARALLILERQVVEQRQQDLLIVPVGLKRVAEEHVLGHRRHAERVDLGRANHRAQVADQRPVDVGLGLVP